MEATEKTTKAMAIRKDLRAVLEVNVATIERSDSFFITDREITEQIRCLVEINWKSFNKTSIRAKEKKS